MIELSPLQQTGADWLRERPRRYLADPPGFGKTRQILDAIGEEPTLVVCPAAIRDANVWKGEAARVGWTAPMDVISYHQLAAKNVDTKKYGAVVFDEAHYLKNRKVSWGLPAVSVAKRIPRVYMASGTPTPNDASELWGQLRVIREMPAFWPWADGNTKPEAKGWFHIGSKVDRAGRVLSEYVITGHLQACVDEGCHNAQRDDRGNLLPVTDIDCVHWKHFREVEQREWMLGRPEELLDLPAMHGADTPLWTPMKPQQRKLYEKLKKDFIASLPDEGIELESLSDSQKFVHLWMLSTGVASIEGNQDPEAKLSGKMAMIEEMLADRNSPTLVACYFRATGRTLVNLCKRMGKSYATFGADTTPTQRRKSIEEFQSGKIDVMIGSIAVVGEGITLTAADGVFLAERMWTPDKNTQVIRRVRRRGQTREVGVRQFVTPRSIDEGQWETLKEKRSRISRVDVVRLLEGEYKEL